ncbi:acyl-CoA dehydrogenase family protein [Sphingomonas cavernae]|uniref:Acyl-CoA dehydrogenase n=1 Tax=Sphingomonas cavernae TaxID=2320861 RepID=A0A418WQV7_9SPHN|nr:acyl-CoA dehydrogenase family protein [Sphingomonas cavernae]RJF93628.1 acyl-CoA dehydrogenase [Sphingomonas cavernae]
MDFTLNTEQQLLSDSVARFIQTEYDFETRAKSVGSGDQRRASRWDTFAANGWLAAAVPGDLGGWGGTAVETAVISQQLGRALFAGPWLGSAVLATQVLIASGNQALIREWLPLLCDGSRRLALAYSEQGARGIAHIVETRATKDGATHRISGRKTLVLGGLGVDAFIVSARSDGAINDRNGVGLFLVAADAAGLSMTATKLHDGTEAADLAFEEVPATVISSNAADGLDGLEYGLSHAMLALCAELVGCMERSIEITAEYLRTRKQFGVPIGSFQSLQHRMADMVAEMELARSMLFAALASFENDDVATHRRVLDGAKTLITTAARNVCGQGIQLHGGIGMTEECAIGHYFKRAVVADALFGSSSLHEAACAAALQDELRAVHA